MTPIYRNTRALRVRFLQVLFWGGALGWLALAIYGAVAGNDAWLVGAILCPIFVLFALGMEWYLRCYVTALDALPEGLTLETLSTFGRARTTVPWADVELAGVRHDISDDDDAPIVDNMAALLRIKGRDMLIIDTTKDAMDDEGLARMMHEANVS
jgi:hypothetical protein